MKRAAILVVLGFVACGKKSETPPEATKVGSGSAMVGSGSGSGSSGPAANNTTGVTDNDQTLVVNAAQIDSPEMTYNTPTGERIPIKVTKRADATWLVDVTVGDKPFETLDTKLAKDDAKLEPIATAVRIQNTVVVVAGSKTKGAEYPKYHFEARVLGWDGKAVTLTKKIAFDYQAMPKPEVEDTHENAGRP